MCNLSNTPTELVSLFGKLFLLPKPSLINIQKSLLLESLYTDLKNKQKHTYYYEINTFLTPLICKLQMAKKQPKICHNIVSISMYFEKSNLSNY